MSEIKPILEIKTENDLEFSESFLESDDHILASKKIKLEKQNEDETENYFVTSGLVELQYQFPEIKTEIDDTFQESLIRYVCFDIFFFMFISHIFAVQNI